MGLAPLRCVDGGAAAGWGGLTYVYTPTGSKRVRLTRSHSRWSVPSSRPNFFLLVVSTTDDDPIETTLFQESRA